MHGCFCKVVIISLLFGASSASFKYVLDVRAAIAAGRKPPLKKDYEPRDGLGTGGRDSDRPLTLMDYLAANTYALFAKDEMDFITGVTSHAKAAPGGGSLKLKGGAPLAGYASPQLDLATKEGAGTVDKVAPGCFTHFHPPQGSEDKIHYDDMSKDFFLRTWQSCLRDQYRLPPGTMVVCPFDRLTSLASRGATNECQQYFVHGQVMSQSSVYPTDKDCIYFLEYFVWIHGRIPDMFSRNFRKELSASLPSKVMPGNGKRPRRKRGGRGGGGRGGRGGGRGRGRG